MEIKHSASAEDHEKSFGWYDKGGALPPVSTEAVNETELDEPVLPPIVGTGAITIPAFGRPKDSDDGE